MTNQGDLQESLRILTGTAYDFNGDWNALFDAYSIASGTINERMVLWLQSALNSSKTNINELKQEYADSLGVSNWNGVYTIGHALPSQQLRVDASDTTTITDSSGNVTAWADKSGNGNNATTTSGTPRTGDSTENGLNIIDFTSDQLSLPSALYSIPNGANTLIVVSKRATEDGTLDVTLGMANATSEDYFHFYSNVSGAQGFENADTGSNSISNISNTNTALNIALCRRTGTYQDISVNGDTPASNLLASSEASIDDAFIGTAGSGGFPLIGSIAEIIIYNRFLSAVEVTCTNNYLANKWGITLV